MVVHSVITDAIPTHVVMPDNLAVKVRCQLDKVNGWANSKRFRFEAEFEGSRRPGKILKSKNFPRNQRNWIDFLLVHFNALFPKLWPEAQIFRKSKVCD